MDEIQLQRDYYTRTAASYDGAHLQSIEEPEHDIALGALIGLSRHYGLHSFLDVGCGTGRAVNEILKQRPDARVVGVEPVAALREIAYAKQISRDVVLEGDATGLAFENDAFDCVSAFGILHHIKQPSVAIREMLRVAKKAIFISDLNNFGCGSLPQRIVSQTLNALGLWKAFQFVVTRGRGYKFSEGDGIHYSYSVYNDYRWLVRHCRTVHVLNTKGRGVSPYRTCSHVALLAIKDQGFSDEKKGA